MGYVLWRVLFKGKKAQTKKALVLPSDQSAWSTAGDGASPGVLSWEFRFGNLFLKVGKHRVPKRKTRIMEEPETSIFKKNAIIF